MTEPTNGTNILVWSHTYSPRAWELIPAEDWNPPVTDNLDASWNDFQFTNDAFGIAVTITVLRFDQNGNSHEGYLIPVDGPCPLCTGTGRILVRVDMRNSAAYAGETLDALLTKGLTADVIANIGVVDMTKPCPACRIPNYLLAADEHLPEVDY